MILVTPWSIWGNQSIGNFAVSKIAICLTNLQHCRNRGCLFALYWLHAKKEMSLLYDLYILTKIEVPLKWYLWLLEVFEEIRVLETLQYPKWRFASPICNPVEIRVRQDSTSTNSQNVGWQIIFVIAWPWTHKFTPVISILKVSLKNTCGSMALSSQIYSRNFQLKIIQLADYHSLLLP